MRLQLTVLAFAGCAAKRSAGWGDLDARTAVYTDTDATTVTTAVASVRANLTEEVVLGARRLVDLTSSASVDVVSAATDRFTEPRNETAASLAFADGTTTASADYVRSVEVDWWSHNVSLGGSRDFLQHNLTVGLGGTFTDNTIGRAADPAFEEHSQVVGGSLYAVVVQSPKDIWKVSWTLSRGDGYQASPYRLVRFDDEGLPPEVFLGQPETLPDVRDRHAVTARYNRSLWPSAALRSHLRGYADDWGILSLTGGTEWAVHGGPVEAGLDVRGYAQRGAAFWSDGYGTRRVYMTSDRELSPFWDVFAGGRLGLHAEPRGGPEQLRVELALHVFHFTFLDFAPLPTRQGLVAEAGVGMSL